MYCQDMRNSIKCMTVFFVFGTNDTRKRKESGILILEQV